MENPEILSNYNTVEVLQTPYGPPSGPLTTGQINGVECVILSRHGRLHEFSPTNINYRANIWALKEQGNNFKKILKLFTFLGVNVILATAACGSLREDYAPGDLCFLSSFIDR